MKFGYARVSTEEQNLDRQLDQLKEYGVERIYQEKMTGTKKDRPELSKLLDYARKGDSIVVIDLTRLSRSTKDLISISEDLASRGIELVSLKEQIDTSSAQGKFYFGMLAIMAQFERDIISERTREGLNAARARGKLGGRPAKVDDNKKKAIIELYNKKELTINEICKMFDISKPTLYKIVGDNNG